MADTDTDKPIPQSTIPDNETPTYSAQNPVAYPTPGAQPENVEPRPATPVDDRNLEGRGDVRATFPSSNATDEEIMAEIIAEKGRLSAEAALKAEAANASSQLDQQGEPIEDNLAEAHEAAGIPPPGPNDPYAQEPVEPTDPAAPIDQREDDDVPDAPFNFTTHAQAETALNEWHVDKGEIDGWVNMSVKDKTAALNEYFGL